MLSKKFLLLTIFLYNFSVYAQQNQVGNGLFNYAEALKETTEIDSKTGALINRQNALHKKIENKSAIITSNNSRISALGAQITGVGDPAFIELERIKSENQALEAEIMNLRGELRGIALERRSYRAQKQKAQSRMTSSADETQDSKVDSSKNTGDADTAQVEGGLQAQKEVEERRQQEENAAMNMNNNGEVVGAVCTDQQGKEHYSAVNYAEYKQCTQENDCNAYTTYCIGGVRSVMQCTYIDATCNSTKNVATCQSACQKAAQVCTGKQAANAQTNLKSCQTPQQGFVDSGGAQRIGTCAYNGAACDDDYNYGMESAPVPQRRPEIGGSSGTGMGSGGSGEVITKTSTDGSGAGTGTGTGSGSGTSAADPNDSYSSADPNDTSNAGGGGEANTAKTADNDSGHTSGGSNNSNSNGGNSSGYGQSGSGFPGFNGGGPANVAGADSSEVTGGSNRNISSDAVGGSRSGSAGLGGISGDYYRGGSPNDYGGRNGEYTVASNNTPGDNNYGGSTGAGLLNNDLGVGTASVNGNTAQGEAGSKGTTPSFFNHKGLGLEQDKDGNVLINGKKYSLDQLRRRKPAGMSDQEYRRILELIASKVRAKNRFLASANMSKDPCLNALIKMKAISVGAESVLEGRSGIHFVPTNFEGDAQVQQAFRNSQNPSSRLLSPPIECQ